MDGSDGRVIAWNLTPAAAWWAWGRSLVRQGHPGRVAVAGALLALAVGGLYPVSAGAASSDPQGGLVYLFLPFWLSVGVVLLLALGAAAERFVAWSARPPSQRR